MHGGGAYRIWRERALDHLSRDRHGATRSDVCNLLLWAERQSSELDRGAIQAGAREVSLDGNVENISTELLSAIRFIITDGAMQRFGARTSGGGLELWRRLHAEMQGAAPEVALAKAERFQQPDRAPTLAALWDRLAAWEALGLEVEAGGHKIEDWVRVCALKRLVTKELAEDLATRPECREYRSALAFVRSRLSHNRAITQAAAVTKHPDDMQVGNLGAAAGAAQPSPAWMASQPDPWTAVQELQQQAWEMQQYLGAFAKGKGKGKKGGGGNLPFLPPTGARGGGKGGAGGGKGGAGGGGKGGFGGNCFHCGEPGHKRSECAKYTAFLQAKGGGSGPGSLNQMGTDGGSGSG